MISIKITCEGNYTLTANSDSFNSSTSQTFEVVANSISMHLTVVSEADINIKFIITFGLYDIKGSMWTNEEYFNVYSSEASFECEEKTENIKYTDYEITLHCLIGKSGFHKITVESGVANKTVSINILSLSLKFEPDTFNVKTI